MAYEPDKLAVMAQSINGPTLWHYGGTDAVGEVNASGYFTDAGAKGMKARDFVLVRGANAGAGALMYVSAVTAGAGTVVDITS